MSRTSGIRLAPGRPHLAVLMIEHTGQGGVADYTECLVNSLTSAGVDVEVVTARDHRISLAAPARVRPTFFFLREGSAWRTLARRLLAHKIVNAVAYLLAIIRLLPIARRTDIVHFQGRVPLVDVVSFSALRATGAKIVLTPHNTFDRGRSWRRTSELCWQLSDRLILHTRADLKNLPEKSAAKAAIIPHGEYSGLTQEGILGDRLGTRARLGIPADALTVLVFGQLRPDKGIDEVLAAAKSLSGLHVIVAGADLGAAESVRAVTSAPEFAGRLHLSVGFQSIEDAANWFAAADVTVLAYRMASQSGVLMLSYAFERPVVVYPTGGLPDAVIDGRSGWITRSANVDELRLTLAAAMRVGTEECARMGRFAAKMASEEFDWRKIANDTVELYRHVLEQSGRTRRPPGRPRVPR
jgi:glycosyltransferase involved in cell wall biosynthesis